MFYMHEKTKLDNISKAPLKITTFKDINYYKIRMVQIPSEDTSVDILEKMSNSNVKYRALTKETIKKVGKKEGILMIYLFLLYIATGVSWPKTLKYDLEILLYNKYLC